MFASQTKALHMIFAVIHFQRQKYNLIIVIIFIYFRDVAKYFKFDSNIFAINRLFMYNDTTLHKTPAYLKIRYHVSLP